MKLVTRCPECNTAFRVYEEQLEARGGQVRCGACKQVFDAYASLEERPLDAEGPPTLMPREQPRRTAQAGAAPAQASTAPVAAAKPRVVDIAGAATTAPGVASVPAPAAALPQQASTYPESPGETGIEDEASDDERARVGWIVASALLALTALLQLAFVYRGDIVARFPGTRAVFEPTCSLLGCKIALPRITENIQIESSDLQSDGASLLTLTTVMRNKAGFAQALPALELTLTDNRDQPVARRVLRPIDYLESPASDSAGIPAGGDIVAKVYIDSSQLAAQSYRLFVFYP